MKRTKETSRKGWNKMTGAQKLSICEDSIIETNFVSTLTFGSSIHTPRGTPANINIESIAKKTHAAVYHPSFDSVTLKLLSPPVTTTIYSTGVAVFMGADSDTKVIAAAHKIAYIITENQKEVIDPDSGRLTAVYIETVNIHNVVASVLAFPLDATILMRDWGHAIEQPEKFSGLTLTCAHLPITPPTNIVITIFPESGKMNITGARCKSEIPPVYRFVHEHILIPAEIKTTLRPAKKVRKSAVEDRDMDSDEDSDEEDEEDDEEEDDDADYDPFLRVPVSGAPIPLNQHMMFSFLMNAHNRSAH